jgi:hypothetical protein
MKKLIVIILPLVLFLSLAGVAKATVVFEDHFDDASLDPAWATSFTNATGWTYNESGTNLTVSEIHSADLGTWAMVTLSKAFSPLLDFSVDFDFSWDSMAEGSNSLEAMQNLYFVLYDSSYNPVIYGGYHDAWASNKGEKSAHAGGNHYNSGAGTLDFSGSASIDISRVGDAINIFWDDDLLVSGLDGTPISGIDLRFSYYPSVKVSGAFFGSESVDLVKVQSAHAPEPATILLLSTGLMGMGALRKRFRKQ